MCVYLCVRARVFDKAYGTPNGTGRWPVAQCHDKIPHWFNSKITWANILMQYWILTLTSIIVLLMLNVVRGVKNTLAHQELDLSQFGAS